MRKVSLVSLKGDLSAKIADKMELKEIDMHFMCIEMDVKWNIEAKISFLASIYTFSNIRSDESVYI